MTIELTHRQHFDVSAETYWKELCLNLAYQERLYGEALGCSQMQVLENTGSYETGMKRRLRFTKSIDAPAAIAKLVGSHVTIEEHSEFDAMQQSWSYRMVPAIIGERVDIRGRVRVLANATGVEQISENSVSCRLFGLGSIIEPFVARSTEEGNADKTAFTRRYIEQHKLYLPR